MRYRPITTEGWLDQLLANAWHPTRMYRILAGKVADHILHSTPQRMWALIVRLGDCPPPTGNDPYAEVTAGVLGVAEERLTAADLAYWTAFAENLHDVLAPHGAEPLTRRDLLWLIRKPGARAPAGRGRTGHPPPTLAGRVLRARRQHPGPEHRRRVHPTVPP